MNAKHGRYEFDYTWDDFNYLRALSSDYSGIIAGDDKFNLFYSRLAKRLRALNLNSFKAYCHYLEKHRQQEFGEFINAITTNLTAFFREKHHFDYLQTELVPQLLSSKSERRISLWSAGCSTGEEAYSLAMTLLETIPPEWRIKILATDIDTQVLQTAARGIYTIEQASGLSEERLKRWFKKGVGVNAGKIKAKPELREVIVFKSLNLMQPWPISQPFDGVFCRNVLIYFDKPTKQRLVQRFAGLLPPGGHLFIGHSESLYQLKSGFELLGQTIYRRTHEAVGS